MRLASVLAAATLASAGPLVVSGFGPPAPAQASVWLKRSAEALGGEDKLRKLTAIETDGMAVLYQREQSERPEGPWVTTYTDFNDLRSFGANAVRRRSRIRGYSTPDWVNNRDWQPETRTLVVDGVGLRRANDKWSPVATPWDLATLPLALEPARVVTAALDAVDLRAEPDVQLDGYAHHVVSFTEGAPGTARRARVRLFLNVPSMIPKAVEIHRARPFETFWAPWGDVTQRVTFGIWLVEPEGVRFPRLWEYSTGGQVDGRVDITRVRLNPRLEPSDFTIPDETRQTFITNRRRITDIPFGSPQRPAAELAPGIVKVPASWDIVLVKQEDGVVIIEGPLTSSYSEKVIEDAQKRFPGAPLKAVVTTSDSWPHLGGMREYAARSIPIYALDLNVPILERLFSATFDTFPDRLARAPKTPRFHVVAGKTVVGSGANRLEIYPLRTVTGERQMMVYFPEHALLYTSDLFTVTPDGRVFLPQEVSEGIDAAARERLAVTRAFGMHYDVMPWTKIIESARPPVYEK
jgi:hypothetical protein